MDVSCHRPFLPGTSLEPAVIPTAQASLLLLLLLVVVVVVVVVVVAVVVVSSSSSSSSSSSLFVLLLTMYVPYGTRVQQFDNYSFSLTM